MVVIFVENGVGRTVFALGTKSKYKYKGGEKSTVMGGK